MSKIVDINKFFNSLPDNDLSYLVKAELMAITENNSVTQPIGNWYDMLQQVPASVGTFGNTSHGGYVGNQQHTAPVSTKDSKGSESEIDKLNHLKVSIKGLIANAHNNKNMNPNLFLGDAYNTKYPAFGNGNTSAKFILKESIEPIKPPSLRVKKETINKGTIQEFVNKYVEFTTSKGNNVKVNFFNDGEFVEFSFSVNGSSKEELREKDPEILPMVLGTIVSIAKKYNIDKIKIVAVKDENDTKIIKGIPLGNTRNDLLDIIDKVIKEVEKYDTSNEQPSSIQMRLLEKRGETFDPNAKKNAILNTLLELKNGIDFEGIVKTYGGNLSYFENNKYIPDSYKKILCDKIKDYHKAFMSNTDKGFEKRENRRFNVYKRILPKLFPDYTINLEPMYDTITMVKNG